MVNQELKMKYLPSGVNEKQYDIMDIIPQSRLHAVIILCSKEYVPTPWCVMYRGEDWYFALRQEVLDFCECNHWIK